MTELERLVALVAHVVERAGKQKPAARPIRPVVFRPQCVAVKAEPVTSAVTVTMERMNFLHQGTRRTA